MRLYFLVSGVNPGIPGFLADFLKHSKDEVVSVGCVPLATGQRPYKWFLRQLAFWGARGVAAYGWRVLKQKGKGLLTGVATAKGVDIAHVCAHYNLHNEHVSDPNDCAFVESLIARQVDVLVSFQPWILRPSTLAAARQVSINVHTGILPGYRGLRPVFRMMSDGLSELGVSVHTMTDQIDLGRVLHVERWPNRPGSTVLENNRKAYKAASAAVIVALQRIRSGDVKAAGFVPSDSPYWKNPTRTELRAAYQKGVRLL